MTTTTTMTMSDHILMMSTLVIRLRIYDLNRYAVRNYCRTTTCKHSFDSHVRKAYETKLCYRVTVPKVRRLPKLMSSVTEEYTVQHHDMIQVDQRFQSFTERSSGITAKWLALQGFFCRRRDEENAATTDICCFVCGFILRNDTLLTQAPLREHCRLAPNCPFASSLYRSLLRLSDTQRYNILYGTFMRANEVNVLLPIELVDLRRRKASQNTPMPYDWRRTYELESSRVESFRRLRWPLEDNLPAVHMAQCGFVSIGIDGLRSRMKYMYHPIGRRRLIMMVPPIDDAAGDDAVQCFACGGIFYNWQDAACPWTEHASWYPNCSFVVKGKVQ
ncbi:E3 ubiquitin-protein ligase XIAP-like [Odontomachus brunneus]|uniref:E3 ubiquitin-protein ligase XIAP-like n=1 Tax=Odontomachus brunneus TaxID=486640 RepID=UPI0013F1F7F7|nr:E3 ubiquitin-protein ligase XIAP-like [Odontomachus brunneus]